MTTIPMPDDNVQSVQGTEEQRTPVEIYEARLAAIRKKYDLGEEFSDARVNQIMQADDREFARRIVREYADTTKEVPDLTSHLLTLAQALARPRPKPLVRNIIDRDTLAQFYGPSTSGKTFLTVGMSCCIALGLPWMGHAVPQRGIVVYVAAEGDSTLALRVLAWCEAHGVNPENLDGWFYILPIAVQLGEKDMVQGAVTMVAQLRPVLTVLDTRHRCSTGLEENSATDMGIAIRAANAIREAAACTVVVIHHPGKDGKGSGRGSGSWYNALDTEFFVTSEGRGANRVLTFTNTKQKSMPDGSVDIMGLVPYRISEELLPVLDGPDDDPEDDETNRNTLVCVALSNVPRGGGTFGSRLGADEMTTWYVCGTFADPSGCTLAELTKALNKPKSSVQRWVNVLVEAGILEKTPSSGWPRYLCVEHHPDHSK